MMLRESQFLLSLDDLKSIFLHQFTVFDVALAYVLIYVVYKVIGRYVYFKTEEHSSKINRTFLFLSLTIVFLHSFNSLMSNLPFEPEHRWFYALCGLALLIAPLSLLMDRVVWKYRLEGDKYERYEEYLPIEKDYSKAVVPQKTGQSGYITEYQEIEGVKPTKKNLHSDALLNMLSLFVFLCSGISWTYKSIPNFGWSSFIFSIFIFLWITAVFVDRGIFSWIKYLEEKWYESSLASQPDENGFWQHARKKLKIWETL